ncbi:N-acetylmuramoyl-L-alanine amidase [Clostridium botulinum]|uniref:N-acetylmuramoyl-L-alanine amidase n=1 Tax=Clostridium botulinum TaxID=1491 RepID=UPI001E2D2955|nr:N-acetylmuramoyl-L-alanine amidase [Clostridium botulinum]MCD3223927.1 amidase [Clostridium botulinum C/D]MCD3297882.1 amidase [Clostridium botulinum C/D]
MNIEKHLINYNYSRNNNIKYIVIHDTGNTDKGANAMCHYRYFNGGNRNASAHYFVDDTRIVQTVEDFNASWHCGDGHNRYGINNHNSIGVEICINSDGNYNEAVRKTIELVKYLMQKYNISINRVVRHYDASKKCCPASMSSNNWAKWNWFKSQLGHVVNVGVKSEYGTVTATVLNVRSQATTNSNVLGQLKNGQQVHIFKDCGNGWYEIYYGQHGGYVSKQYIR